VKDEQEEEVVVGSSAAAAVFLDPAGSLPLGEASLDVGSTWLV
jgi:hypothetical protein